MSRFIRNALRVSGLKNLLSTTSSLGIGTANQASRSVWHMSSRLTNRNIPGSSVQLLKPTINCDNTVCRCFQHTEAESELKELLADKIEEEKEVHDEMQPIPSELDGFSVSLDGPEVTLMKTEGDEKITIMFNVNNSLIADKEFDSDSDSDYSDCYDYISKPQFTVDITREGQTLAFSCSFLAGSGSSREDSAGNIFKINKISFFHGERKDKIYAMDTKVLDYELYQTLMEYLEEKGINCEFVDKLGELSTAYEHGAYISVLESISNFTRASK